VANGFSCYKEFIRHVNFCVELWHLNHHTKSRTYLNICLEEMGSKDVNWIHLIQDHVRLADHSICGVEPSDSTTRDDALQHLTWHIKCEIFRHSKFHTLLTHPFSWNVSLFLVYFLCFIRKYMFVVSCPCLSLIVTFQIAEGFFLRNLAQTSCYVNIPPPYIQFLTKNITNMVAR
jgi:hypothetical protein